MARLAPFRGIRYDTTRADLAEVTAPPYDVVDDALRAALAGRDPHNAVHVDLPVPQDGRDRYATACHLFHRWLDEGVLVPEPEPALYGYRMAFTDPAGRPRHTTGVLGALTLAAPGEGEILPHEHTTPKARSDRLDMLRACQANLSAIWTLAPVAGLTEAIGPVPDDACTWSDDDGVEHALWPITDTTRQSAIADLVASEPVLIADGHHRYETSLAYRDELRAARGADAGEAEATLALVVELVDHELTVLPIHRLVDGLGDDPAAALSPWFEPGATVALEPGLVDRLEAEGALGLVVGDATDAQLLHPRPEALAGARDLDTSRLDVALAALPGTAVRYQHGVEEVAAAVRDGDGTVGVLLRPATVAQIAETAHGGDRMPPKTTFFHPKPRTGVVFRDLR